MFIPHRERRSRILSLALPIIGGMASQNVLNLVDTAMVGTLGAVSLAAVGQASFANFMAIAFITGLGAGVQAMAARRVGEGRDSEVAVPLNGGLFLALVLGVPASILLITFADRWFPLLTSDPAVAEVGVPYLRARLFAMAAVGCNFAFRGFWNATDRPMLYMRTLIAMHVMNIALNWVLIFGHLGAPRLGATGAGIASAVAMTFGALLYVVQALRLARDQGFLAGFPARENLAGMLRLSVPAGLQQFFFAAGMTAFFWIIGRVGTAEMAASTVLVQLLLVAILPGLGFGLAAASLVGQALGRGDAADARRWGWDVATMSALVVAVISVVGVAAPDLLLRPFLHDPLLLDLARWPLRLLGLSMFLDTVGMVLLNALLGAGHNRVVMAVSIGLQWGLMLPAAFLVGPVLGFGMLGVWIVQITYRLVQAGCFAVIWSGDRWALTRV
jgi:MATE family multidrug resistance protein